MHTRGLRAMAIGVVLLLTAAACGGGGGDETGDAASAGASAGAGAATEAFAQDFQQATVMVVSNNTHLAAMAAAEQGFWLQHGLDVKLEVLDSGREIMTAVGAGEAQFGGVNAGTTVPPARAGGLEVSVVVPYMNNALAVADVGRVALLARNDMTVDDVEFVNTEVPDMAVALEQGLVDAVVPWEPYVSQILREQGDNAVVVERGGDYVSDVIGLATLDSLVTEQPDLVEKLILGILEGAQFVRQNPEQAAEILTSYVGGVEVADVVEGNQQTSYDPRVSVCTEKGVMDAAQALIDSGEIESEPFELKELLNVEMLTQLTEDNPQFFDDLEPLPEDLAGCQ
ncbi:MAG TPA: ABC transporter substrate-binding protein [Euzebyales bacterium]|nr:ABC transporter substrate-binding protein [Euzebyales bacterium]